MEWKLAMVFALPLMFGMGWRAKCRTWAALMGASLASIVLPYAAAFMVIDLLAGAMVLRRPAGCGQRAIGLIFAGMALFDIGFIIAGQHDVQAFTGFMVSLGWLQFAILFAWGGYDHWGHHLRRGWAACGLPLVDAGRP